MLLALVPVGLACSGAESDVTDTSSRATVAPATTLEPTVDLPDVVVTYSVLASVVGNLVAGVADVVTIIPDGSDPHAFEPSAKDLETIDDAAFVVANGLDLEEGLEAALERLRDAGRPVFFVGDHVGVREIGEHADDHGHDHGDGHDHGGMDPHLWLSPGAMLEMLPALAGQLETALNTDLSAALAASTSELTALDEELSSLVSALDSCLLVTGHDELGYFADRYGCTTIGAIVPGSTTTSEASAGELADLIAVIKLHRAKVVFTSLGTPAAVAGQVAAETGATVVELSTHVMGDSESYADFMRSFATRIVDALR